MWGLRESGLGQGAGGTIQTILISAQRRAGLRGSQTPASTSPARGEACSLTLPQQKGTVLDGAPHSARSWQERREAALEPLLCVRQTLCGLSTCLLGGSHSHPSREVFSPQFPDGAPEAWRDGAIAQADPGTRVEGDEHTGKGDRKSQPQRD